jgi:hypothetical protein
MVNDNCCGNCILDLIFCNVMFSRREKYDTPFSLSARVLQSQSL